VKYIIGAVLCISFLSECSTSTTKTAATDSTATASVIPTGVRGIYKGDFGGSPIYITINYSSDNHVAGYNTHKGLRRNISGTVSQTADGWELDVNEPGDHPFDGKFKLVFDTAFAKVRGQWAPMSTTSGLTEKTFTLSRMVDQTGDDMIFNAAMSADHADITFNKDGSCIFNYYDKLTDTTFAQQMNTLRGTWEQKDSLITVNWQKNEHWGKSSSVFTVERDIENGYNTGVDGEGYHFYPGP
jgi:hypothetical protein